MARGQHGVALVVALLMLIAVSLLGMSAAQIALQNEKAARNDRDRQIAFQAAEAALMDAELDIEGAGAAAPPPGSRSSIFDPRSTEGFAEGCAAGKDNPYLGLCSGAVSGVAPAWQTVDFLDDGADARTVPYGRFTGEIFQTGQGPLPARAPRYIIELMAYNRAGEAATLGERSYFYRITAIGFGARDSTQVVLQTFYRKERR